MKASHLSTLTKCSMFSSLCSRSSLLFTFVSFAPHLFLFVWYIPFLFVLFLFSSLSSSLVAFYLNFHQSELLLLFFYVHLLSRCEMLSTTIPCTAFIKRWLLILSFSSYPFPPFLFFTALTSRSLSVSPILYRTCVCLPRSR